MSKFKVIRFVYLDAQKHMDTGRTKHFFGAEELPKPYQLKIIQYHNDPGYYLVYFDKNEIELTDTYHDTLQEAIEQAKWEFNVEREEWK